MVPGAVVWEATVTGPGRVLPDGCMDLIWLDGDVVVAGPDTRPYATHGRVGDRCVGLRFRPGALPDLLGVPAAELRNLRVPLRDVLPGAGSRSLAERVGEASDRGHELERFAMSYPDVAGNTGIPAIVRRLRAGWTVSAVADDMGLGERHLHRLSLRQFGYGPKTLARILRFQSALQLAGSGYSGAEVAVQAGYADQAHLIRETRALAGASFDGLVRS